MKKQALLATAIVLIALIGLGGVLSYTYIKVGNKYIVTLENGKNVTVENITYNKQTRTITATINKTALKMEDLYWLDKAIKDVQNQIDKKNNNYTLTIIGRT